MAHRRFALVQSGFAAAPPGEARPLPVLGPSHEFRAQRVALDITEHGRQMVVVLDGKGLESALPDMSRGAVMAMVSPGVGREQPLDPAAQIAVMSGPRD